MDIDSCLGITDRLTVGMYIKGKGELALQQATPGRKELITGVETLAIWD